MTPWRQKILRDLRAGHRIIITQDSRDGFKAISYTLEGGGRHNERTLELFVPILLEQKIIKPQDDGLFKGCSQTLVVVR